MGWGSGTPRPRGALGTPPPSPAASPPLLDTTAAPEAQLAFHGSTERPFGSNTVQLPPTTRKPAWEAGFQHRRALNWIAGRLRGIARGTGRAWRLYRRRYGVFERALRSRHPWGIV